MSEHHHHEDLRFSPQELSELRAELAHGPPVPGTLTDTPGRIKPSPFDLLVEAAFAAELGAQGGSSAPFERITPRRETTDPSGQHAAPGYGESQPISSSPPPVLAHPPGSSRPSRRKTISGEISSPVATAEPRRAGEAQRGRSDPRATVPNIPSLRDDSPFGGSTVEVTHPGELPHRPSPEARALAKAIGMASPRVDSSHGQGHEDVMSSSPPLTSTALRVAVSASAGGSALVNPSSAIEALTHAVRDVAYEDDEESEEQPERIITSELPVVEDEDDLPEGVSASALTPPLQIGRAHV